MVLNDTQKSERLKSLMKKLSVKHNKAFDDSQINATASGHLNNTLHHSIKKVDEDNKLDNLRQKSFTNHQGTVDEKVVE